MGIQNTHHLNMKQMIDSRIFQQQQDHGQLKLASVMHLSLSYNDQQNLLSHQALFCLQLNKFHFHNNLFAIYMDMQITMESQIMLAYQQHLLDILHYKNFHQCSPIHIAMLDHIIGLSPLKQGFNTGQYQRMPNSSHIDLDLQLSQLYPQIDNQERLDSLALKLSFKALLRGESYYFEVYMLNILNKEKNTIQFLLSPISKIIYSYMILALSKSIFLQNKIIVELEDNFSLGKFLNRRIISAKLPNIILKCISRERISDLDQRNEIEENEGMRKKPIYFRFNFHLFTFVFKIIYIMNRQHLIKKKILLFYLLLKYILIFLSSELLRNQMIQIFYNNIIQMEPQAVQDTKKMKVDKYDRQIRLWGPKGQKYLGQARVALVNCTGAGIQALKNLILPGVGVIDIWDDSVIKVEDLSTSFFYQQTSVGQFKGQVASRNLLEMNEDCKGRFVNRNFNSFIEDEQAIISYNLVIFGGDLSIQQTKKASQILWKFGVPCIFITIIGYFAYIRLQKQIHYVESSNTLAKKYYLRICNPYPELLEHANRNCVYTGLERLKGKDPESFKDDFQQFLRIPSILILISVANRLPKQQRKIPFMLKELNSLLQQAHQNYRQNIRDAISKVGFVVQNSNNYMVDKSLLTDQKVSECDKSSHPMIKFLWATQQFFKQTNQLPQPTSLPDMDTTTKRFIELKNIFKEKHAEDLKVLVDKIRQRFQEEVNESQISDYINNLNNLEIIKMKPYFEELKKPDVNSFCNYLQTQRDKDLYLAIRSYQQIIKQVNPQQLDYNTLKDVAERLKTQYQINSYDQRFLRQAHRSKGFTNISICSIAGALVGQQSIKLISGCFAPMNGGYLFDGVNGKGYQLKL